MLLFSNVIFYFLSNESLAFHHTHTHAGSSRVLMSDGVEWSVLFSYSLHRCPKIPQMTANEGNLPSFMTWIICHRQLGWMLRSSPHHPSPVDPLFTLIHPCEAFTHSLSFWSAVCQRLLPLKRRWQPLIITRAERRAFLSAEIFMQTHTQMLLSPLHPHTYAERRHLASTGLRCIWQMSKRFVPSSCPIPAEPGTSRPRPGCNNRSPHQHT